MKKRLIGMAFLIGGVIAMVYGYEARKTIHSKFMQSLTGYPNAHARQLLIGGAASATLGVCLILLKRD